MAISPWKKIVFLTLAVCIAFSVASTIVLAAQSFNHTCCKNETSGCLPCLQIEAAKSFIRALRLALFFMLFAVCLLFHALSPKTYTSNSIISSLSPIALKVRFNT